MARSLARGHIRISPELQRAIRLADSAIIARDASKVAKDGGGTAFGVGGAPFTSVDVHTDTYGGPKRETKKDASPYRVRESETRGGAGGMG